MGMDPGKLVRDARDRVAFLLTLDRRVAEVLDVLRDTHRILAKLEGIVDGLDEKLEQVTEIDVSAERIS